ncbi:MAG: WG repeat-containing protein [Pyrinomonadaceae bacterium]
MLSGNEQRLTVLVLLTFFVWAGSARAGEPAVPHPGLYPATDAKSDWGFIDATGRFRIPPIYDGADEFSDGVAYVWRWDGKLRHNGIVDPQGKFTELPTNDSHIDFSEGLARFQTPSNQERFFGFMNKTGRVVIAPRFYEAGQFSEGFAWVSEWRDRELLYGFIDRTGKYVVPLRFKTKPRDFVNGRAWVMAERDYAFIDRTGKLHFEGKYRLMDYYFAEGLLAAVTTGADPRGVYLDRDGREVLNIPAWNERTALQHSEADQSWRQLDAPFQEGLAPYHSYNKIGFIDRTGKIVIPAQFRGTRGFAGGMAPVYVIGPDGEYLWGYIDRTGEMVIAPTYRLAEMFKGPLAKVTATGGGDQLIDKQGRVIWPAAITKATRLGMLKIRLREFNPRGPSQLTLRLGR